MFPFLVALASDGTFLGILVFSFLAGYCVSALRTWKMEESGEVGGSTLWGTDPTLSPRTSHLAPLVTGGLYVFH